MNKALWSKSVREARPLFLALVALMFGFQWLFVWLTSLVELGAYKAILQLLPGEFHSLVNIPLAKLATDTGRISLAYVDPVVIFAVLSWSLARGSDCVAGEIGRGTMEMLLAQPISRLAVLGVQATVTTAGAALLAVAAWLGTVQGLAVCKLSDEVSAADFVPAAINLFALTFFLSAASSLVSACDSYRWRAIGIMGGFYVIELVIKIVGRLAPKYDWLMYGTFLAAFEPQVMVVSPERVGSMSLRYDGALIGLALACYVLAAIVFCRRDLPAPL
ncbi:MAG TPA: ABC transporter permease subunit [Pirellulales bacterium]|jgi:ABC-2 type transport system permease protein|nr:ABC transporter permease subunit [Pirellulales bacterium]